MATRATAEPEPRGSPRPRRDPQGSRYPGPLWELGRLALIFAALLGVGLLLRHIGYDIGTGALVLLSALVVALGRLLHLLLHRRH